ncbi:MAG TPA: polyribonucleotide nucleotidyltransferase [Nitrospiria bacterium]|nr:polyribonucleotide nucleotidyltransferase [Nitrospiria bacterium]
MGQRVDMMWAGRQLILESGKMAKQADGAVVVQMGDTMVLTTVVTSKTIKPGIDFLPLTVDYKERFYAAGKIPGGFFKREGRPTEKETLVSRLIDRPLRPLFPDGFYYETQIIASVLSLDPACSPDILGMIGASAALLVSDVPFSDPVGAVRIGRIDGELVVNPTPTQLERSELDLVVAGTKDAIIMVEGEAKGLSEDIMLAALELAHQQVQQVIDLEKELSFVIGKPKRQVSLAVTDTTLAAQVAAATESRIAESLRIAQKLERQARLDEILAGVQSSLAPDDAEQQRKIASIFHDLERKRMREIVLQDKKRADGRGPADIRPITCEVGLLPRTHGSALFTRGETQSLSVVTLGTGEDEQRIDALEGESTKSFMLHYNFPPFSVGEARPLRGPGRREIGHGALAERALKAVMPNKEKFPYTVRLVSDILESNGSSSMATVCAGTLALMDAGVPITEPVGGIAMGLIKEGDRVAILSDILGLEDHLGDMDFKVTGTRQGITALQMDMKIGGITSQLLKQALHQAREGRLFIIGKMEEALSVPRTELSTYAPRIVNIRIRPEKIGGLIGPGGKNIRAIIEKTGVKIDVADDGLVSIASTDEGAARQAIEMIQQTTQEVEVGKIYTGRVRRIMEFGAIVQLGPNTDGLVHISQLAPYRVKAVTDILKEGDEVQVKVLEVDKQGKIRLSRKDALPADEAKKESVGG